MCEKVELCVSAIISHIGLAYILDEEQQLQWGQMMAHLLGYPTDIDRQPNREERFRDMVVETKKQAHLCKHSSYIKLQ